MCAALIEVFARLSEERIDADLEWIAAIAFDQKDYMWVSQLQRDRDVVAQYEVRLITQLGQLFVIDDVT